MKEYTKIGNIFKYDEKSRGIVGLTDFYNTFKGMEFIGTEKVDGTNIRIGWDGHRITYAGRTDKAEIPRELSDSLTNTFCTPEMEYVFEQLFDDKTCILFGEGYGAKIQSGGDYSPTQKFILFDVQIDCFYLSRENVADIASKLGLDVVPVVFRGTLDEAITFVSEHHMSTLGNGKHEMEGLVLQPAGEVLYDHRMKPVKCKCKYRDVIKYFETKEG